MANAKQRGPARPLRKQREPATRLRMSVEPHAGEEQRRAVSGRLDLFNVATTGLDEWHTVAIFLRDPDDEIVGGILGETWGGWLHVTYLWVAAPFRGRGHAGALLRRAESFAIARGCHAARLETFSFQAPGFYARQGYQVFGTLEDCPQPGHRQFFLRKTLAAGPRPAKAATARGTGRTLRS